MASANEINVREFKKDEKSILVALKSTQTWVNCSWMKKGRDR